ncbi:hypothetical protein PG999_002980 [Apiospora kogelbergensis]|uniref:Uncharacterized protein n=1 Tax=Apiospora kogelbergensis TaxID=1337665 RepID=A0AAW0R9W3_9PEZI
MSNIRRSPISRADNWDCYAPMETAGRLICPKSRSPRGRKLRVLTHNPIDRLMVNLSYLSAKCAAAG